MRSHASHARPTIDRNPPRTAGRASARRARAPTAPQSPYACRRAGQYAKTLTRPTVPITTAPSRSRSRVRRPSSRSPRTPSRSYGKREEAPLDARHDRLHLVGERWQPELGEVTHHVLAQERGEARVSKLLRHLAPEYA